MGQKSWEFYQQPETGGTIAYPLWWVCGMATAVQAPGGWHTPLVHAHTLWAVPFNQIRAVTVNKMMITITTAGGAGARCRLGIYQNVADSNSKPGALLVDAGELDITTTGIKTLTLGTPTNLLIDNRYW